MSKCNCQDWDDITACNIHGLNKHPRPREVCHTEIVIRIYRRASTLKWFATVTKDAIREFTSDEFETKKEAIKAATGR